MKTPPSPAADAADNNPYRAQPAKAFWKRAVKDVHPLDIADWYSRKFPIAQSRIATAGSCFAQHIGRELQAKQFNYLDLEPAPDFLDQASWQDFGYGIYSARYGNIYSPRQLLQLIQRASGEFQPAEQAWEHQGGFVDPFRPTLEPAPLGSVDEVVQARQHHLRAVMKLFEATDVFVFTLGLTEAWMGVEDGAIHPVAPGISGGRFDPARYRLINFVYHQIRSDLEAFFDRARQINPRMKFILTVSPVPLMATATQHQVVVATMQAKSTLRAVAGQLADSLAYVDYFPSYEIISAPVMRGQFYNADMRTVSPHGVRHVMSQFFKAHPPPAQSAAAPSRPVDSDELACDEELLAVFGESK